MIHRFLNWRIYNHAYLVVAGALAVKPYRGYRLGPFESDQS
ncbi:MAG TPA: hypothetical protein VKA23_03435 [Mariprofundaceae bacterium]|nr:hypothetical protein [Mariprofundaceae bacterium]